MKIVYLSEYYNTADSAGASATIRVMYRAFKKKHDVVIVCNYLQGKEIGDYPVVVLEPDAISNYIIENKIDIIHYFKATGRRYFKKVCSYLQKNECKIPIVTTVCQKPSYKGLELTPVEIKNSNLIIFIDKAAYQDSHYQFIPQGRRNFVYFGYTVEKLKIIDEIRNQEPRNIYGKVVYGRGSSLNKCHNRMIEVFDGINISNKEFIFVGGSILPPFLNSQIIGRTDVTWFKSMAYTEWLKKCATFDVFLYVLPESSYSSIDGTLGDAMLLGIPPVVYGPDAIKERIEHGKSGYIAKTLEEAIDFSTKLGLDEQLRIRMGEEARKRVIDKFPLAKTVSKYDKIYEDIAGKKAEDIKLPISFYIFYFSRLVKIVPKYIKSKIYV